MATGLGGTTPDPGLGASIKLGGGDPGGLFDLVGISKALPGQRIATEEPPPAFLQIEPAGTCRNEDMMEAWMLGHPGAGLGTVMAAEIIRDNEDVTRWIVGFDVLKECDVVRRVARSGTASEFLAIPDSQGSIDPGFLGIATVVQGRFDAVPGGGPAGGRREGARDHWPQFVGADGRRAFGRLRVVADDRGSFGTKSSSLLVPQLCVRRQRTPSRSKMVRI